jgi:mitochondrial ornithine carrier protein
MVSKVFEHPFDLTKVRLQSQVLDSTARFSGPIDCLTKTWKNEGITGLYRVNLNSCCNCNQIDRTSVQGLPAPIVGAMVENASLFLSYSQFQNFIRWYAAPSSQYILPLHQLAIAAAGAGAVTSFLLYVQISPSSVCIPDN